MFFKGKGTCLSGVSTKNCQKNTTEAANIYSGEGKCLDISYGQKNKPGISSLLGFGIFFNNF
jgi:hypothetical protein